MSIEFGGKKVTATLSGLFDGFAMIGAVASGLIPVIFDKSIFWNMLYLFNIISCGFIIIVTIIYSIVDFSLRKCKKQQH